MGMRKIDYEKAELIRRLYQTGKYTQRHLAKKFEVSHSLIFFIVNNKHITTKERLSPAIAERIRRDYHSNTTITQVELAEKYHCHVNTIGLILRNKLYERNKSNGERR